MKIKLSFPQRILMTLVWVRALLTSLLLILLLIVALDLVSTAYTKGVSYTFESIKTGLFKGDGNED